MTDSRPGSDGGDSVSRHTEAVQAADRSDAPFTVLIPAHNEAAVIGRTLRSILDGVPPESAPDIFVIPNGCTDDTAGEARRAAPSAKVIELAVGSKALAINEGLSRTRAYPVIVLDADVIIGPAALEALARTLREPGVMAASPSAKMELGGSDRWIRAFYRVWARHDYLESGVGGSGVYGLSEAGAKELGELPRIIADDTYVRRAFPLSQQRRVGRTEAGEAVFSRVQAPQRIGNLINCEARWHSGNVQLRTILNEPQKAEAEAGQRKGPGERAGAADLAVYYAVKVLGRGLYFYNRLRGRAGGWHRDTSRR